MTGADIGIGWIDQGGKVHFQVRKMSSILCIVTQICLIMSFSRIGMHSVLLDPLSTIQQPIGLLFKDVSKMDGLLFNSNVCLTPVTRWMFRSK
jgi:hypothetical protein